uniref:Uncharacterized protein n=1 Tax=Rhizophora mucronata TaxID=61149 RepID=A0A2P2NRX4_RHIMU
MNTPQEVGWLIWVNDFTHWIYLCSKRLIIK